VVEHSVYVDSAVRGQGIGRRLLDTLIASTEAAGFRVVGTRERIGQHHGRWRDVIFIERRSPAV
jgi:L-amino acid N-acyltransferase YncA